MATAEQPSDDKNDSSTVQNQRRSFSGVLGDDGRETMDMVLRHTKGVVDELRLHIDADGWSFKAVDPANVAMIDVRIPNDVFESYEYESSEELSIGVNVDDLNDALQNENGGHIRINHDDTEDETPKMNVGDSEITLIDPDSIRMEPEVPDMDLPTTAVIDDIELFDHFCNNVPSDHIQISASMEGVACHAEGDTDSATLLLPDGDGCNVRETTHKDATRVTVEQRPSDFHGDSDKDVSLFSQDYLTEVFGKLLVKHKRGVSYELKLGTEFPLYLTRQDGSDSDSNSDVNITYMLAPRIQS